MKVDLAAHVRTNRKVRVTRSTPCEPLLNGYVLDVSDSLALLHVIPDFSPDGYSIIRLEDVEKVRSGPYERFWDYMLSAEGLLEGLKFDARIDLSSMRAAIESVAERYDHLIIECEDAEEDEEDFYIGSLMWTSAENTVLRHFDGLGYWAAEHAEIDVDEITRVQFDTPYDRLFSKYTREGEPPEVGEED